MSAAKLLILYLNIEEAYHARKPTNVAFISPLYVPDYNEKHWEDCEDIQDLDVVRDKRHCPRYVEVGE